MKHVFIITYGRTGSTALMKALNSIKGACLRGENGGLLRPIAEAFMISQRSRRRHGEASGPVSHPWYGAGEMRPHRFGTNLAQAFTRDVLAPPDGTRLTGFKEIRYTADGLTDQAFRGILRFMLTQFEDSRVIFLTRNPDEVADSAWWQTRDRDIVIDVLEATIERFRHAHEDFPEQTFLLDHASFNSDPEGLRPLLQWLGEEIPPEALAAALAERVAEASGTGSPDEEDADASEDTEPELAADLSH
ncbi:sulfotransferase [Tropicimonas sediminicola]|uniref:Sulfotransferase family protein n=1 Tax=Tropicimonas sediminicola TaxID=1031541 RepID=A0A239LXY5_9RHOB|nr:sulfotransferase [Tropicimonas sediminicola]SNT34738.1 Sulfotransferase family protein [Tropicimonas sediminicola]